MLIRLSAWIQQNQDLCLMAVLALLPLAQLPEVHIYVHYALLFLISGISLAVTSAKMRAVVGTRVARTEHWWLLLWVMSLVVMLMYALRPQLADYALPMLTMSLFLVSFNDRVQRYRLAKIRILKRRVQQARWRRSKRAVLSEWKDRLRWLAGVQHDMRQPLHALGLLVRHPSLQASSGSILGPSNRPLLVTDQLIGCHQWLQELAENTMEAARLELGEQRAQEISSINSTELSQHLCQWIRNLAESKGLQFHTEVEDTTLRTDLRRLKRVLGNLLFNAVEHTFEGEVSLRYRRQGGIHLFEIKDTGPGMSLQLSQPKESCASSFGSDLPKTGLGLYVVKRLCWEMEWNLSVHNELSGGTVFRLELADRLLVGDSRLSLKAQA